MQRNFAADPTSVLLTCTKRAAEARSGRKYIKTIEALMICTKTAEKVPGSNDSHCSLSKDISLLVVAFSKGHFLDPDKARQSEYLICRGTLFSLTSLMPKVNKNMYIEIWITTRPKPNSRSVGLAPCFNIQL